GPVTVISYSFWQQHFGGAVTVIGAPLIIERVPFTVVGVTPPEFFGPEVGRLFDVAIPIGNEPLIRGGDTALDHRTNFWLSVAFRLPKARSLESVSAALRTMQDEIRQASLPPDTPPAMFMVRPFELTPAARGTSGLRPQ